jgi:hypothetical protein
VFFFCIELDPAPYCYTPFFPKYVFSMLVVGYKDDAIHSIVRLHLVGETKISHMEIMLTDNTLTYVVIPFSFNLANGLDEAVLPSRSKSKSLFFSSIPDEDHNFTLRFTSSNTIGVREVQTPSNFPHILTTSLLSPLALDTLYSKVSGLL